MVKGFVHWLQLMGPTTGMELKEWPLRIFLSFSFSLESFSFSFTFSFSFSFSCERKEIVNCTLGGLPFTWATQMACGRWCWQMLWTNVRRTVLGNSVFINWRAVGLRENDGKAGAAQQCCRRPVQRFLYGHTQCPKSNPGRRLLMLEKGCLGRQGISGSHSAAHTDSKKWLRARCRTERKKGWWQFWDQPAGEEG